MSLGNHVFKKATNNPAPYSAPALKGKRKVGNPYKIDGITYYPINSSAGFRQKGIASWYGRDFHGKKTANGERYNMHAYTAAHKELPLPTWVRVTNLENGKSVVVRVNDRGPFVRGRIIDMSYTGARMLGMVDSGIAPVLVEALPEDGSDLRVARKAYQPKYQPQSEVTQKSTLKAFKKQPVQVASNNNSFTNRVSQKKVEPKPYQAPKYTLSPQIEAEEIPQHPSVSASKQVEHYKNVKVYVQTGAFGDVNNANRQKLKVAEIFSNTALQPVDRGAQTLQRVRVGPFDNVAEADRVLARLVEAGFNTAVIAVD